MMNMIELQNKLKNFSQEQLVGMMQQPSGDAPQFMVLGEITRRQKMQQEATKAPTQSVAQEAVSAAGVPQGGIADMARTLAPQTNVAQNTGAMSAPPQDMPSAPQGIAKMASGGVIKMQAAGKIDYARYRELARRLIRNDSFSPEELKELEQIKGTSAFMDAEYAAEYELANPDFRRVESSAPTPVFDATVEAPSLNQAPAADAGVNEDTTTFYTEIALHQGPHTTLLHRKCLFHRKRIVCRKVQGPLAHKLTSRETYTQCWVMVQLLTRRVVHPLPLLQNWLVQKL
jgi:hypothetical protein